MGGVSYPLFDDHHPQGALAKRLGIWLDAPDKGVVARATLLIDPAGVIRWSQVTPLEQGRDAHELLARAKGFGGAGAPAVARLGATEHFELFVREGCGHCKAACRAATNARAPRNRILVWDVEKSDEGMQRLLAISGADAGTPTLATFDAGQVVRVEVGAEACVRRFGETFALVG